MPVTICAAMRVSPGTMPAKTQAPQRDCRERANARLLVHPLALPAYDGTQERGY